MRVEYELSAPRVRLRVLEKSHELCHERRMQTCIDFIRKEDRPVFESLNNRSDKTEPHPSPE